MLSTKIAPPPGASSVAALRRRARAAGRAARIALTSSIALLCAVQLVAERAPAGQDTLPLAVLALAVLLAALPALALTQAVWGARARAVRRRESELYAAPPPAPGRALSRLAVAAGWAVLVLLGGTVPQLFADAGRSVPAEALTGATAALPATAAAVACFAAWRAVTHRRHHPRTPRHHHPTPHPPPPTTRTPAPAPQTAPAPDRRGEAAFGPRAGPGHRWWVGRAPVDPWDPGRGARTGARGPVLWVCAAVAVAALVGARAHLWDPHTAAVYALLAATLVCGVVTGE